MKSHFSEKLYMHTLQKELRMSTAWSVNKKGCCLISIGTEITEILLSFCYCKSHLASRKKNLSELVIFVCSEFHFFFSPAWSFLHVKATDIYPYIILYFLFWNLPLKSKCKRTHLVPTTISHWITGKYSWLNLRKPTIEGLLKSKPLHFHSSQRWQKKKVSLNLKEKGEVGGFQSTNERALLQWFKILCLLRIFSWQSIRLNLELCI